MYGENIDIYGENDQGVRDRVNNRPAILVDRLVNGVTRRHTHKTDFPVYILTGGCL